MPPTGIRGIWTLVRSTYLFGFVDRQFEIANFDGGLRWTLATCFDIDVHDALGLAHSNGTNDMA